MNSIEPLTDATEVFNRMVASGATKNNTDSFINFLVYFGAVKHYGEMAEEMHELFEILSEVEKENIYHTAIMPAIHF